MPLNMARPYQHSKTGVYWVRKVVPARLREAVGKREFRRSLRTKDPAEARRRAPAVLAQLDAQIAAAENGALFGFGDLKALEGEYHRTRKTELLERALREGWDADAFDAAEHQLEAVIDEARPYGDEAAAAAQWGVERARKLIEESGATVPPEMRERLATRLYVAERDALAAARYELVGDRNAPKAAEHPHFKRRPRSLYELFERYAKSTGLTPRTHEEWCRIIRHFEQWLGGKPPREVESADLYRYADHLREGGGLGGRRLSTRRINEGYLAAIRAVYQWALRRDEVERNPAAGVSLKSTGIEQNRPGRRAYTKAEAAAILIAARSWEPGYRRWCPWLCAFTGARISEVLNARKAAIGEVEGISYIAIQPEKGGQLKTGSSRRMVPLHPALIAEGFLDYVASVPKGEYLFPGKWQDKYGNRTKTPANRLREAVRGVVAETREIGPNHSFRHWLVAECRRAGISDEITRQLTGHAAKDVHGRYGLDDVPGLYKSLHRIESPLP